MTKIYLKDLECIRTSSGGFGADDVYIKITIDNQRKKIRLPRSGVYELDEGQRVKLNQKYEFENFLKLELYDEDTFSSDDFLGSYKFLATQTGSGKATISNPTEGDEYELSYEVIPGKIKTARLSSAKCVLVSSSIDAEVIKAVSNVASQAASAFGEVIKGVPNPKAKLIGQALEAASKVITGIPDVAEAIDQASGYPDQLFITTNNQPEVSQRIWPKPPKEFEEIRSGQIVRFENLVFPLTSPLDFSLWEYDYVTSSDFLGAFAIETEIPTGAYVETVTSTTECSIYLVAYTVQEEAF
ncbi:MAG: hypothetical protein F6K21_20590 [Symploca sp. SIO2D2]|nr:hypothetical protein [Symploca sp. SIO2D2]